VIGQVTAYKSEFGICKNLWGDVKFSVATATKEAAKMAIKQINHVLK
jgi:hypothetical protein